MARTRRAAVHQDMFSTTVRKICASAGIVDWETVVVAKQIEAGGHPVALFGEAEAPSALGLYVDLAPPLATADVAILTRLLEANMVTGDAKAFFCLVPGQGTIALRSM